MIISKASMESSTGCPKSHAPSLTSYILRYSMESSTGCPKSHAPSLTRYILRYENGMAIKEICLDRVTLYDFCDTKLDPIDHYLNELP